MKDDVSDLYFVLTEVIGQLESYFKTELTKSHDLKFKIDLANINTQMDSLLLSVEEGKIQKTDLEEVKNFVLSIDINILKKCLTSSLFEEFKQLCIPDEEIVLLETEENGTER